MHNLKLAAPQHEDHEYLTGIPELQEEAHKAQAYEYLQSIHMMGRYACISGIIRAMKCRSVLDVGCGEGTLCTYLGSTASYLGIDVSGTAISRARSKNPTTEGREFIAGDFRKLISLVQGRQFDAIVWAGIGLGWRESQDGPWIESLLPIVRQFQELAHDKSILVFESLYEYLDALMPLFASLSPVTGIDLFMPFAGAHNRRFIRVLSPRP